MAGPFSPELIEQMVQQELRNNPAALEQPKPMDLGLQHPMPSSPMSPEKLATFGALADIAGTYAGLKTHKGGEDNAMLAGHGPEGVALGLGAQFGVQKGATALLRKVGFKQLADAIAANTGAMQAGLGADWARILMNDRDPRGGFDVNRDRMDRNLIEETKRLQTR